MIFVWGGMMGMTIRMGWHEELLCTIQETINK